MPNAARIAACVLGLTASSFAEPAPYLTVAVRCAVVGDRIPGGEELNDYLTAHDATFEPIYGFPAAYWLHIRGDLDEVANHLRQYRGVFVQVTREELGTIAGERVPDLFAGWNYASQNKTGHDARIKAAERWAELWGIQPHGTVVAWDAGFGVHKATEQPPGYGVTFLDAEFVYVRGWNAYNNSNANWDQCGGHGSHVLGIAGARAFNGLGIHGVASGVRVSMVTVLQGCWGTQSKLAAGIMWALDNYDPRSLIGNASLQYYDPAHWTLIQATERALERGVVLVAASGNAGGPLSRPASIEGWLAVGATDVDGRRAQWSNAGVGLFMSAPGVDIPSLIVGGFVNNGVGTMSGTSMASPHVAGTVAMLRGINPEMGGDEIRHHLRMGAGDQPWDWLLGYGHLDVYKTLASATPQGDFNRDGVYDQADVTAWMTAFEDGSERANCDGSTDIRGNATLTTADWVCWWKRFQGGR